MDRIRILLVDDHALFREGIGRLIDVEQDMDVVACCAAVAEAVNILRRKPVDVVLLDHDLGNERGFDFMIRSRQSGFKGRFLIVTAGMSDTECVQSFELGASGIFLKHNSPDLLTKAIRRVFSGETWLDDPVVQALIRVAKKREPSDQKNLFNERENLVLRGVFEGLSNKEIGLRLNVSESTVKASLQNLFRKTGVRNRSQLVRIALENHR